IERAPAAGLGRERSGAAVIDALRAAFPAAGTIGAPAVRASNILRELETGPRRIYGGAVGYFGVDGSGGLALGLSSIWVEQGELEVTTGSRIGRDSVPQAGVERTRSRARGPLSAIRAAQDARKARDAAAEKKAAAERAAAERAAIASAGGELPGEGGA